MVCNVLAPNFLSGDHGDHDEEQGDFDATMTVDENYGDQSDLDFNQTTDEDFDLEQDDFTLDGNDDELGLDLNDFSDSSSEPSSETEDFNFGETQAGDNFDLEMTTDDTITPDFDLGLENESSDLGSLDLVMDKSGAELETPASGELEISESDSEGLIASPDLNFGDIDISDLEAPVEKPATKQSIQVNPDGVDLEDLQMGDLGLESSATPAVTPKGKPGSKVKKTGTALDDFEIDLGDLISKD